MRNIATLLLVLAAITTSAQPYQIGIGSTANDGTGDKPRAVGAKINSNNVFFVETKLNNTNGFAYGLKLDGESVIGQIWTATDTIGGGAWSNAPASGPGSDPNALTNAIFGTEGNAPSVVVVGKTVTVNLPSASDGVTGPLTSSDWNTFNDKPSLSAATNIAANVAQTVVAALLASGTNSLAVTNLTIEGINTNVLLFVGADSNVFGVPIGAGLTNDGGTLKATGTSVGSSAFNISNIVVSTTNNILLDLASFDVFKLYLLTNCNYTLSNASALDNRAQIYFQQDTNGNRTAYHAVAGGLLQTNANMQPTATTNALDMLEVMPGFFSTNLVAWWPKDFQPRVAFTNSLAVGGITYSGLAASREWASGTSTDTITITNTVEVGNRLSVTVCYEPGGATPGLGLSAVSDSKGNTYTIHSESVNNGQYLASAIASSLISSELVNSDTLTLTWTNATYAAKTCMLAEFSGVVGTVDVVNTYPNAFSETFALNYTTLNGNDLALVGTGIANTGTYTPTDGSLIQIAVQNNGNGKQFFTFYRILAATGTYNAGGTLGTAGSAHSEVVTLQAQ
jgi:hypothetical protein